MQFIDKNADRYPSSPLEPLIQSVMLVQPDYDFGSVDIVTDRQPIRKLLDFLEGTAEDFRFGAKLVGNTIFFVRMERVTREMIPVGEFRGYRAAFEEAYTHIEPYAAGSASHHRVVEYMFGGLRMVVRFAVDCSIHSQHLKETDDETSIRLPALSTTIPPYIKKVFTRSQDTKTTAKGETPSLEVVRGPEEVSNLKLAEIKTRFKDAKVAFKFGKKLPDLWISQVPQFINAAHENVGTTWSRAHSDQTRRGIFNHNDIQITDVRGEIDAWEIKNSQTLERLVAVLKRLSSLLKEGQGGKAPPKPYVLSYAKGRSFITLARATDASMPGLPDDLPSKRSSRAQTPN